MKEKSFMKLSTMWNSTEDDEEQQDYFLEGTEGLCSLSPMQRIYGFGACLLAGVVCMFLSLIVFAMPIKFALLFTFGNVLAVGSTAFVIGPRQQLSMMLDDVRVYATAVYGGCVIVALVCALLIHSKILTLIAVICEICRSTKVLPFLGSCLMCSLFQPFGPLQKIKAASLAGSLAIMPSIFA